MNLEKGPTVLAETSFGRGLRCKIVRATRLGRVKNKTSGLTVMVAVKDGRRRQCAWAPWDTAWRTEGDRMAALGGFGNGVAFYFNSCRRCNDVSGSEYARLTDAAPGDEPLLLSRLTLTGRGALTAHRTLSAHRGTGADRTQDTDHGVEGHGWEQGSPAKPRGKGPAEAPVPRSTCHCRGVCGIWSSTIGTQRHLLRAAPRPGYACP